MKRDELRDNLIGRIERQIDPQDQGTCAARQLAAVVVDGSLDKTADYKWTLGDSQQYFFLLGVASEAMACLQMHPDLAPRFHEAFGGENYSGDRRRLDLLVSAQIVQLLSPIEMARSSRRIPGNVDW
jgi:hypothetical protein